MRKLFPLFLGFASVLAFGLAYAADSGSGAASDKMITNDDLPQSSGDQDNSTFNQMPAGSGIEGSGAGGAVDSDTMKNDSSQGTEPDVLPPPPEPSKEPGPAQPGMDTDRSGY